MPSYRIVSYQIPGYAPNLLIDWLKLTERNLGEHYLHVHRLRSRIDKGFIPFIGHILNFWSCLKTPKLEYDLVVTPDPLTTLALHYSRIKTSRLCYWRLDYHPRKFGPLNFIYQWLETKALKVADEVWSMADPTSPIVQRQLMYKVNLGRHTKVKHVPYMLPRLPQEHYVGERVDRAIWVGPDRSRTRVLFASIKPALEHVKIEHRIVDYSIPELRVEQIVLDYLLATSKVGVALYDPGRRAGKFYSDPARIRHYLANGIPVITTRVPPVWKEIESYAAGVILDLVHDEQENRVRLELAIRTCIEDFDVMSPNARALGEKYVMTGERFGLVQEA